MQLEPFEAVQLPRMQRRSMICGAVMSPGVPRGAAERFGTAGSRPTRALASVLVLLEVGVRAAWWCAPRGKIARTSGRRSGSTCGPAEVGGELDLRAQGAPPTAYSF